MKVNVIARIKTHSNKNATDSNIGRCFISADVSLLLFSQNIIMLGKARQG
jgi:hypothetical protein